MYVWPQVLHRLRLRMVADASKGAEPGDRISMISARPSYILRDSPHMSLP